MIEKLKYTSSSAPAISISVLVDYLKDRDAPHFVYRGQTADYGALLPSGVRSAITGRPLSEGILELEIGQSHRRLNAKGRAKLRMLRYLINIYGKGLGNVIAQQYGLTSECLDMTRDIDIASFFATRMYPKYEHASENGGENLGAIYRYRYDKFSTGLSGLDLTLGLIGTRTAERNTPVWFLKYVFDWQLSDTELSEQIQERPTEQRVLFTHPITLAFEDMPRYIKEHAESQPKRSALVPLVYENTRLKAQAGGLFIPSYFHSCTFAVEKEVIRSDRLSKNFFKPGWAISHGVIAVHDLATNFKAAGAKSSLEVFYFKHSGEEVTAVKREQLWPDRGSDPMYNALMTAVEMAEYKYLESTGVSADDQWEGILDKGYYE